MSTPKNQGRKIKGLSLGSYKFETSSYVIMKGDARRDSHTGRLMSGKAGKKSSAPTTSD